MDESLAKKFVNWAKQSTSIGRAASARDKAARDAGGDNMPTQREQEPEMEMGTNKDTGMPEWQTKSKPPKFKDGGVIEKELLRRRAAVKQKRGC